MDLQPFIISDNNKTVNEAQVMTSYMTTTWAIKKEPSYFYLSLREKSMDFNVVFTVRFRKERHM